MEEDPPGLFCRFCQAKIVNFTIDKRGDGGSQDGDCLNLNLVVAILQADAFEQKALSSQQVSVRPPIDCSYRGKGASSSRAIRDNARLAANAIGRWKSDAGMSDHIVYYIAANDKNLLKFLLRHHPQLQKHFKKAEPIHGSPGLLDMPSFCQQTCSSAAAVFNRVTEGEDLLDNVSDSVSAAAASASISARSGSFDADVDMTALASDVEINEICASTELATLSDEYEFFEEETDADYSTNDEDDDAPGEWEDVHENKEEENDNQLPPDLITVTSRKANATHRHAFAVVKATIHLSDNKTTKLLTIWKNLRPVADWKNFRTDGRLLAPPDKKYLKQARIRKVVCGLGKSDFVPFHDAEKREKMMQCYEETGTTIEAEKIKFTGECIDFDIEKSLLMQSPGNLNPLRHETCLKKIHRAKPNLLSAEFLKIVDEPMYQREKLYPNPERPLMNLLSLKFHSDGVQIAKNSTKSECVPLSFSINGMYPFDPVTNSIPDTTKGQIISALDSSVHTTTVYHGNQSCCVFQFAEHMIEQTDRLNPRNVSPGVLDRKLVVVRHLTIADAIERFKRLGKNEMNKKSCTYVTFAYVLRQLLITTADFQG